MEKDLKYGALLDVYSHLLTEKQAEALDYYYNEDYSLAEISELMSITRQGVRDFIKRGEMLLCDAEDKLGLYKMLEGLDEIGRKAVRIAEISQGEAAELARHIVSIAESMSVREKSNGI